MLTVIEALCSASCNRSSEMAFRSLSAIVPAVSRLRPGNRTANSSPPIRAVNSRGPTAFCNTEPTARNARSPSACPQVSFRFLKWSRSIIKSASGSCFLPASNTSRIATSSIALRLRSLVRLSVRVSSCSRQLVSPTNNPTNENDSNVTDIIVAARNITMNKSSRPLLRHDSIGRWPSMFTTIISIAGTSRLALTREATRIPFVLWVHSTATALTPIPSAMHRPTKTARC